MTTYPDKVTDRFKSAMVHYRGGGGTMNSVSFEFKFTDEDYYTDVESILDIIFAGLNSGSGRERFQQDGIPPRIRSMCVGDTVEVNGNFYFCDCAGWVKLTLEVHNKVKQLSFRDALMGWEWVKRVSLDNLVNL